MPLLRQTAWNKASRRGGGDVAFIRERQRRPVTASKCDSNWTPLCEASRRGAGDGIRTHEWKLGRLLPYHLATPASTPLRLADDTFDFSIPPPPQKQTPSLSTGCSILCPHRPAHCPGTSRTSKTAKICYYSARVSQLPVARGVDSPESICRSSHERDRIPN